jgi:hypothetical protein
VSCEVKEVGESGEKGALLYAMQPYSLGDIKKRRNVKYLPFINMGHWNAWWHWCIVGNVTFISPKGVHVR